jgi:transposase
MSGCGDVSHSRHSRYWRRLRDLPVPGIAVHVKLQLGRWRCRSRECLRGIFVERISGVALPYARQICRLGDVQVLVGRAMGGRPGQRLMNRLGMPTGRQTLIRQVTAAARRASCAKPIRVLGVDDWAWNKGKSFGTILVDLERSVVADLLPTRSADSLAAWLEKHPEVMVVSRDRQGSYADGARRGAPQARQVADRFHLTLNLTQAVERELAVQRQHLQLAPSHVLEVQTAAPLDRARHAGRQVPIQSKVWQQEVERGRQRRQENMELFETLHRMKATGLKVTEMAKELGLNRRRLDRWLHFDAHAAAARYAGSLSRILATTVGSGLQAWSNSFCGSPETRLRRLLLQTGGTPLPVASTIGSVSNAIAGDSSSGGDDYCARAASFTTSGGSTAGQDRLQIDVEAKRNRGPIQAVLFPVTLSCANWF